MYDNHNTTSREQAGGEREEVASLPAIQKGNSPPAIYDMSHEPEDESDLDLHPHQKYFPMGEERNNLKYGWQIIGASRRGYAHAYEGKYREDDFSIRLCGDDLALVAIADGLGSRSMSRRGARAAVLGATGIPEERLMELVQLVRESAQDEQYQEIAYTILIDALSAARDKVNERAQEDNLHVDELHSTLLVFVALPYDQRQLFVASVQIGDGALFVLQPDKGPQPLDKWYALQRPQIQETGNEVQPFMRTGPDTWIHFLQCDLLADASFMMGMTDGTADDIEPPYKTLENPNPDPFLYVNSFYRHIASGVLNEDTPAEALLNFLGYRKRQSFDDRTVVCLYRLRSGEV